MRYAGVPRSTVKQVEDTDAPTQQRVAARAVEAVRAALPADEPAVTAALAAMRSGSPVSSETAAALEQLTSRYAEQVDDIEETGASGGTAAVNHTHLAVEVLQSAVVVDGADRGDRGDRVLRAVSIALMVVGADSAGGESLLAEVEGVLH